MTFTHRLSFLVFSFIYSSSLWWSLSCAALTPGTLPLAVRSPYLSCWESSQSTEFPALNQWPTIWSTESQVLGWEGLIRVDNTPYRWLGLHSDSTSSAANATNATAVSITPTRTIVTIPAGPMTLNVTFLSPIEPGDYVRQSMPFSYLYLEATSNDGKAHSVQVYSDISGEWNSGNRNDAISWTTTSGTNSMFHAITLDKQTPFTETANQAEWGTMYHAGQASSTATYQIAADATNRGQFTSKGNLLDTVDPNFRQISNSFPVFGISQDLGTITSTQKPVVWAVGFTRDQAVQYTDLSGVAQNRSLYYKANFTTDSALIDEFILDFPNAVQRAQQLDSKILTAAQNISSDYADIVSLAARQVFAATELTISQSSDGSGSYNTSDVMMFMKNIGGASEGRVNAVETLFASFPMFMFIDPTLGAPLLEPLLRFQNSPAYKSNFAAADIGSGYPVAKATTQGTSQLAVEQTANMIIMAAAHARDTGDGNLVATYYDLLKGWTDYLVNNTLFTSGQFSADQNTVSNQTNLALKGIVAIKAMSQLSTALGNGADAQLYATESTNLFAQWESFAVDPSTNALLDAFGQSSSFTLGYNLFADLWLGTNLVNSTVLAAQTASYGTQAQSVKFGLPTDSTDTTDANAGWNMFAAGIATDPTVRDQIVSLVHARASSNSSGYGGFPSVFSATAGNTTTGIASPAQGALFAPLALTVAPKTITVTASSSGDTASGAIAGTKKTSGGTVAGAVIGTLIAVGVLGAGGFYWWRRRQNAQREQYPSRQDVEYTGGYTTRPMGSVDVPPVTIPIPVARTRRVRLPPNEPFDPHVAEDTLSPSASSSSSSTIPPVSQQTLNAMRAVNVNSRPLGDVKGRMSATSNSSNPRLPSHPAMRLARGTSSASSSTLSSTASTIKESPSGSSDTGGGDGSRSGVTSPSTETTNQLLHEVVGLRREMEELRQQRLEPPPSYGD